MMEFHISRAARDRYGFSETLFSLTGNVVFANLSASREFAHRMNVVREAASHPERTVNPAALYTMGMIDEASHALLASYREQFDPAVMTDALAWFSSKVGAENVNLLLLRFVEHFPGVDVYRGTETAGEWLEGSTNGLSHRAAALEELMMLWMANENAAFEPFEELFRDTHLSEKTVYEQVTGGFQDYFATRPLIEIESAREIAALARKTPTERTGAAPKTPKLETEHSIEAAAIARPQAVTILELLRAPALGAPTSLTGQLATIRQAWAPLLGAAMKRELGIASEVLREEDAAIWMRYHPPSEAERAHGHGGDKQAWAEWTPGFGGADGTSAAAPEYEKFSPDVEWMPTTVLLAKSTYVWLAQLSKQYGHSITRLDQIPDEELEVLARRGMNSLWLIGVWERSRASQTIKQLCGNADAVASAYSLFDYNIAEDLGGESAYDDLRDRAYRRGIRLASDMVANHMGIDSPWVVEHPEWFLSRQDSPYPAYDFDGPDLSSDYRVEIKIEKRYYDRTDAAVVFRRIDRQSGEMRYIYHGNDGTSFPWNDTAQLDYLNPGVREQVIQTILRVARMFPVIRFDAAMTLAKRHFHRLWFPGPGSSGAIPSRAEYSMSDEEFNRIMPDEFWREVVDRVAAEVPGTLLLAEAFWLMEGYFVRTLGMHRVYNSAFMVMLRDEDNANYRTVIKKTLEFDPDIMKRYVNFMSNPDERTAIDQFGNGDKCFGVAALMATLPGLPMFGHGQVEGYTEKYGMEYRRPRFDETPDGWLVDRHQRQIAPLLHQRWLFAESSNFRLYDFVQDDGSVEEDVFAYSNRNGDGRSVVLYNNRYSAAHGHIDYSAIYADKGSGEQRQQRLRDSLGFSDDGALVLAYRDSLTGLEYLRRASEVANRGLRMQLQGYECHVFLDWREMRATAEKPWDRLCDQLAGRGVPSVEIALINLHLRPVHDALRELLDPALLQRLSDLAVAADSTHPGSASVSAMAGGSEVLVNLEQDERDGSIAHPPSLLEVKEELVATIAERARRFFAQAETAYATRRGGEQETAREGVLADEAPLPTSRAGEEQAAPDFPRDDAFTKSVEAALRLPEVEASFPTAWPAEVRRVLPSQSPGGPAPAVWAAVLSWCAIDVLAKSAVDAARAGLDIYDHLRLREPLANAFASAGLDGDQSWRAAGRVRVLLRVEAEVAVPPAAAPNWDTADVSPLDGVDGYKSGSPAARSGAEEPALGVLDAPVAASLSVLSASFWEDDDVRWLTGLHESDGVSYFGKDSFGELVWWLQLPALLKLARELTPVPTEVAAISQRIEKALGATSAAAYRLDRLLANGDNDLAARPATLEAESSDRSAPAANVEGDFEIEASPGSGSEALVAPAAVIDLAAARGFPEPQREDADAPASKQLMP